MGVGVVGRLDGQLTHTLQDVGGFLQGAFSRLGQGDAVIGVTGAWFNPVIWEVIRSEIPRPAASSFAELMRRPEDRRCMDFANSD